MTSTDRIDHLIEGAYCLREGTPMPAWIEISLSDACTRRCEYCPKGTPDAPDQPLFMGPHLINKIASDLDNIEYCGTVMLAGYGEPLMSPYVTLAVKAFSNVARVEMVSNGDILTPHLVTELYDNGLSYMMVSLYDGPDPKIAEMLAGREHQLRDRSGTEPVKRTNRAGVLKDEYPALTGPCNYPYYAMMIDWQGDVLVCPQDWHKRVKMGNVSFDSIWDVWTDAPFMQYRRELAVGRKSMPCVLCNCTGTLHGETHKRGFML